MTTSRVNPLWAWPVALAILLGAGVVVAVKPPEQLVQAPFPVNVELGEQGTGRNIEATIHSVTVADVVEMDGFEGWVGETEGVWVVAQVTAAARVGRAPVQSFLLIDEYEFRGSERTDGDGLESWSLTPGIPATGPVLFEIPRDLLDEATSARLVIATNSDWRLDSTIVTTLDLSLAEPEPRVLLPFATWEAP